MEINLSAGHVSEGSHLPLCKEAHGHNGLWRVSLRGSKRSYAWSLAHRGVWLSIECCMKSLLTCSLGFCCCKPAPILGMFGLNILPCFEICRLIYMVL